MKITLALIALAELIAFCPLGWGQDPAPPIGAALQGALDRSSPGSGAVGVAVAVVFADGKTWEGATGISHPGVPLTADMLFDIASVQKNLQAALTLELVEEGVLSLEDPLEKWLPAMPHIDGAITVRQLLNMTSGIDGFVADPNSPFRIGYTNIEFEKQWTWQEIQAAFVGEPDFPPGTDCAYSTTNYIVLKQVLEHAARSKLPALLEVKLLKPQGLAHTLADFSRPIPAALPIAHGWFDIDDDGQPEDLAGKSLNWISSLSPMLVYATPGDLACWLDALYHRKTVLAEETLQQMLTFGGPVQNEPLMKGYGLGVVDIDLGLLLPQWDHVRVFGHLGSQYGYMTFAGYFPDYGTSLVIMSNRGGDVAGTQAIMTVGCAVIDALLGRLESLDTPPTVGGAASG